MSTAPPYSPVVAAMIEQARRCVALVGELEAANGRILARAPDDPARAALAGDRYNAVCRACAERRERGAGQDVGLDALVHDADLRAVCDGRWVLGEELEILRQRLDRLEPVPAAWDDFERLVRRSVTTPDRSPDELGAALQLARERAAAAEQWQPPAAPETETLRVRWQKKLENNPVVAFLMIAFVAIAAVLGVLPKGCLGGNG